jgi:hypothetical protein
MYIHIPIGGVTAGASEITWQQFKSRYLETGQVDHLTVMRTSGGDGTSSGWPVRVYTCTHTIPYHAIHLLISWVGHKQAIGVTLRGANADIKPSDSLSSSPSAAAPV